MRDFEKLLENAHRRKMTRRALLQGLAATAAAAALPLDGLALPSFKPIWLNPLHLYSARHEKPLIGTSSVCDAERNVERKTHCGTAIRLATP
jgi:hypothetical protein